MKTENAPWKWVDGEGYTTLHIVGAPPTEAARKFEAEALKRVETDARHVVVHCGALSELGIAGIRALLALKKSLAAVNKLIRLIQVTPKVQQELLAQGVSSALPSSPTLREAQVELGLATKKALDVDFINPFLAATLKVLEVQASIKAVAGKPSRKEEPGKFSGDVSGVIGLVSESFNGVVVITFPETTFLKIMSRMLGEECSQMTKEIVDGAAELTNMVFGQAKVALNERGYGLHTAIPSVVTGRDHQFQNLTQGPCVIVPFETEVGVFFIEICLSA